MRDPEGIRKSFLEPFIAQQKKFGAFPSAWIERAFLEIPRHLFIRRMRSFDTTYRTLDRMNHTDEDLRTIYSDVAILIHDPLSSSSQPWLMARMLSALDVQPGMRVLEIGTGSGFNAGLLSIGTGDPRLVHSIDIQPDLVSEAGEHLRDAGADGVHLRAGDASDGWPEAAPFDRIIATAGCPDIAPAWIEQLAEGGILLLPFSIPGLRDPVLRLTRRSGSVMGAFIVPSGFMDLQGALGAAPAHRITSGSPRPRRGETRVIRLPGHRPGDFAFFLRSSPTLGSGSEDWLEHPVRWRLIGSRGDWTAVYDYDRETLTCTGCSGSVWNLLHLAERWKALGMPKITAYRVEVSEADPDPSSPADWIDVRPHVRLRISLPA